ncbi:MAG: hypothetical protein H6603_06395 [Flavobacteriales bacterium]|nr:hypothetical protein [Flavobacteriales bacterium]MCB9190352.1 hypothetical protein [Flavobacteriales bacterium]MCB9204592.1 hypothetical protein [Flavobacteriales bacterium]
MTNASDKEILNGVILGFRKLINDRYQFDAIKNKYDIPDTLDQERMVLYRDFFLEQVYPHPERREMLDEAFKSLDNYLTHPDKMLRIVFDSAAILFRHGSSIPKLMSAGLQAFKSFRIATGFEAKLVRKAKNSGKQPPYSTEDINSFIRMLRKKEIDEFVVNTTDLLEILYDRKLVRQIIQIMSELIAKMKKSPRSYSQTEIDGLTIGLEMLQQGNHLFESLPPKDQRRILDIIVAIEVDVLEELFAEEK